MSKGNSPERARMMRALGAEVVLVEQQPGSIPGQVSGADLELVEEVREPVSSARVANECSVRVRRPAAYECGVRVRRPSAAYECSVVVATQTTFFCLSHSFFLFHILVFLYSASTPLWKGGGSISINRASLNQLTKQKHAISTMTAPPSR